MSTGIAGVIYPDILQVTDLVEPMLDTLRHRGSPTLEIRTFKNIQIGIHGGSFGLNEKKNHWLALDGTIDNIEALEKKCARKVEDFR